MNRIQALREQRTEAAREIRSLLDQNPGALWNATHQATYDEKLAAITRCDEEIGHLQNIATLEAERAAEPVLNPRLQNGNKAVALFNRWLRGGDRALNAEDWNTIRNTMSTTTTTQGGYTVPTAVATEVIDSLKAFGGMRSVATIIGTDGGNPMNFPTSDGTSETGEILAENATATGADPSFGVVSLATYKYSSKVVAVPIELLQDSSVNIEAFIRQRLITRLGRITNTHYTVGTGSSQPTGVVVGATSGKVGTTGQTTSVIYDDLVDLIHAVDPAYRVNCRFMANDSSVKVVRKLKDTAGRPLWLPSYDASISGAMADTLLGYPVVTNQDVAVMAANAKSILFGDFSKYLIRDVMAIEMLRFEDSAYAKSGQVGFLAFLRSTGNLLDAKAVAYYTNSAT